MEGTVAYLPYSRTLVRKQDERDLISFSKRKTIMPLYLFLKGNLNVKKFAILAVLGGLLAFSAPAKAQDGAVSADTSYLSLGAGIWDVTQDDDMATDFRVEYRHGDSLFWKIKPWAGVEGTTDGSIWGGVGVLADFKPADNIYITPSFGAGLYSQGGSDKDLDHVIEFRSQLEAGYEFMNQQRVGVAFGHISNANLGDDNPGTEILNVYYHVPVGSLF